MNKKPGLLFSVCILALIILAVVFDMHMGTNEAIHLRAGINPDNVLYVCPIENSTWQQISQALSIGSKYIYMFLGFFFIVLLFSWSWALYQNLLKDKFNKDAYKNSWGLTKIFFWAVIICVICMATPNHFRTVHIHVNGQNTEWVLCENNSVGARAVSAKAVKLD